MIHTEIIIVNDQYAPNDSIKMYKWLSIIFKKVKILTHRQI